MSTYKYYLYTEIIYGKNVITIIVHYKKRYHGYRQRVQFNDVQIVISQFSSFSMQPKQNMPGYTSRMISIVC